MSIILTHDQNNVRTVPTAGSSTRQTGSKFQKHSYPPRFYEQLMRHDWHSKVRNRIKQRGWSE